MGRLTMWCLVQCFYLKILYPKDMADVYYFLFMFIISLIWVCLPLILAISDELREFLIKRERIKQ